MSTTLGPLFCYSIPPFHSSVPFQHPIPLIPDVRPGQLLIKMSQYVYITLNFINEVLHLVTYVQLFYTIVKVTVTGYTGLP